MSERDLHQAVSFLEEQNRDLRERLEAQEEEFYGLVRALARFYHSNEDNHCMEGTLEDSLLGFLYGDFSEMFDEAVRQGRKSAEDD